MVLGMEGTTKLYMGKYQKLFSRHHNIVPSLYNLVHPFYGSIVYSDDHATDEILRHLLWKWKQYQPGYLRWSCMLCCKSRVKQGFFRGWRDQGWRGRRRGKKGFELVKTSCASGRISSGACIEACCTPQAARWSNSRRRGIPLASECPLGWCSAATSWWQWSSPSWPRWHARRRWSPRACPWAPWRHTSPGWVQCCSSGGTQTCLSGWRWAAPSCGIWWWCHKYRPPLYPYPWPGRWSRQRFMHLWYVEPTFLSPNDIMT